MEEGRSSRDNLYADECGPRFFFSPPPLPPSLIIVFFTFFASSESSSLAKRISGIGARPEERNTSRLDRFEITVGLSTERKRYSNVVHPVTFVATSHATKFNLIIFYLGTWCYVARRVLLTLFYNSVYINYRNKELLVVARRRGRDGGGDRGRDGEFKVRARVLGKKGVVYMCVGNYTFSRNAFTFCHYQGGGGGRGGKCRSLHLSLLLHMRRRQQRQQQQQRRAAAARQEVPSTP